MNNIHSSGESRNHDTSGKSESEDESSEHFFEDSWHITELCSSKDKTYDQEEETEAHGDV